MSEVSSTDVAVVGGGIAGLAVAFHLARGGARVMLLEREALLASHASGRNAAIFRHLDGDPDGARLAIRSRELLARLGEPDALLRRTGALYLGDRRRLRDLAALGADAGVAASPVDGADALAARSAALARGPGRAGLWVPDDGVIDGHAIVSALEQGARSVGARILTGAPVEEIVATGRRVSGVRHSGGRLLRARAVVVAAGAWAGPLGATCGAPRELRPLRRHLVLLAADAAAAASAAGPVVWSLEPEVYFRPEAGGVLASPCDEDPWEAGDPSGASDAGERLAARLGGVAPGLLGARVRTAWACLRTFAPDRRFVVGGDPRVSGLFWLAGLGGRGMTCGLALGELLAARIGGARVTIDRG